MSLAFAFATALGAADIIGRRVRIVVSDPRGEIAEKTNGMTGTVIGTEGTRPRMYRVRFDRPIKWSWSDRPSTSDLYERSYLKLLRG